MKTTGVLVLTVLGLTACASSGEIRSAEVYRDALDRGVCEGILNSRECAQAKESLLLRENPSAGVRRDGDRLLLELRDGRVHTAADVEAEDETGIWYNWVGAIGTRFWVVHGQHLEGNVHLLVDRQTGREHPLWDVPWPSEQRDRIFVGSLDLEARYNPNGIQLFRVEPERVVLEYELAADDWGPANPRWRGSSVVEFEKVRYCEDSWEHCRSPARLVWDGAAWELDADETELSW
jgi:hypothetical protein